MLFKCRVEQCQMSKPCQVKTCVWHSESTKTGCFGHLLLDESDMTPELVAQHKAMSAQQVTALRNKGIDAIENASAIAGFIHWVDKQPSVKERMQFLLSKRRKSFRKWTMQHPAYQLKTVRWTVEAAAASVMKAYWTDYSFASGCSADWLETLGLDETDVAAAMSILQRKGNPK